MSSILRLATGLLLGAGLALTTAHAQQGSGIRYRVTTKMEMQGMAIPMPTQSQEICGPKNSGGENMVPHQDNCQVLDYKVSGNKSSFRMVCTGRDAMTGSGEFEMLGDGYRGKITVNADGNTMFLNFDGKRLGECDYSREGPQAKANQMLGRTCDGMLAQPAESLVGAFDQFTKAGALCSAKKAAYCKKIGPLASNLDFIRSRAASEAQIRQNGGIFTNMWDAFEGCGLSRTSILAKDCPLAEKSGNYDFIGELCPDLLAGACDRADPFKSGEFLIDRCPARAGQIAAQQCAGRGYTALSSSPYREFCNAYAGKRLQQRNGSGPNGNDAGKPAAPAKKPSLRDRLKGLTNGAFGGG